MQLSKYARIGNAPLIKAVGIQKNYKEVIYTESQELDRAATGCYYCDNFKNIDFIDYMPEEIKIDALNKCANCPYATYKTVTHEEFKYINEKNMYGNAPRLKVISMKLLITYHFMNPDDQGVITGVSPKELADYLNCTVKSIHNANDKLQQYGYIMFCNDGFSKNKINIQLTEYSTYPLSADQGGRGYATFNKECLDELINITDINQLRIFIRATLVANKSNVTYDDIIINFEYDSLRKFLPGYCKPGIIKKAVSSISNLFDITCQEDQILMKLNPDYCGRRIYDLQSSENAENIESYMAQIDEMMNKANTYALKDEKDNNIIEDLNKEGIYNTITTYSNKELYVTFDLKPKDIKDLGILATTYSIDRVKSCISYVYENYQSKFRTKKIAALIRTILKQEDRNTATLPSFSY